MESEFEQLAITSDEKEQTGWYNLPYEMRIMIIELMDTKTKGNLSCCSKLCCTEFNHDITLRINYPDYVSNFVFSKITENGREQCLIDYKIGITIKYSKTVDGSMKDVVLDHFNRFLNDAIHLKEIEIKAMSDFPFDKTSITHMKKLETIEILQNGAIDLLECGFLSINQLISATIDVHIEYTNIEIDQLINFKAERIILRHVVFSPTQLNQYLKAWDNNQIDQNVDWVKIECSDGMDLYDFADEIVSGLEVVEIDIFGREKWFNTENIAGKAVSIEILPEKIGIFFEKHDTSDNYYDYHDSDL